MLEALLLITTPLLIVWLWAIKRIISSPLLTNPYTDLLNSYFTLFQIFLAMQFVILVALFVPGWCIRRVPR